MFNLSSEGYEAFDLKNKSIDSCSAGLKPGPLEELLLLAFASEEIVELMSFCFSRCTSRS